MAEFVGPVDRGLESARQPLKYLERAKRRRDRFIVRIARARTPGDKLNSAMDYFRATAKDPKVDPVKAAVATEHLAERLIDAGDQLARTMRRWP